MQWAARFITEICLMERMSIIDFLVFQKIQANKL